MRTGLSITAVAAIAALGCMNMLLPEKIVTLNVEKVDAPSTVASTSPLDVVLTVNRGACQTYDRIDARRRGSGVTLTVVGKDPQKGCTDLGIMEAHTYRIAPPLPAGMFTITVNRGDLSPLMTTVAVQ